MRFPLIADFQELNPAARRFLLFVGLNVWSWQCILGDVLVLFAREVHMPPSWIGWLLAFMPMSQLLVLFSISLVERLGPKRLMMGAWLLRNSVACLIFLAPWVMARWGFPGVWALVMLVTLLYSVVRASAMGGWFPWIYETVPDHLRGRYFGLEARVIQIMAVLYAFFVGLYLSATAGVSRFYWLYALAIVSGFVSVALLGATAGGGRIVKAHGGRGTWKAYGHALRDRRFMRFCLLAAFSLVGFSALKSASVLYLREELGLPAGRIMLISCLGGLGVVYTVVFWGRFADGHGSARTIPLALVGLALAGLGWLAIPPWGWWSRTGAWAVFALTAVFQAAVNTTILRGLLCQIREEERVAYCNVYIGTATLVVGSTPVVVGLLIERGGLAGFTACFAAATTLSLIAAVFSLRIKEAGRAPAPYVGRLLNPLAPVRTLARVVWITAGLDETARSGPSNPDSK